METPQGKARSAWRIERGKLRMTVTIPMNSVGEVWVPTQFGSISAPAGAVFSRQTNSAKIYTISPGTTEFITEGQ
jgi:alpha-L-rhamnosidase